MSSINQTVLSVLNTEPTSFDAEDEFDPDTEAKIISKKDIDTPTKGFLGRSKKPEFGDDLHGRYAGKIVKRSEIFNDDDDDDDCSSDEDEDDEMDVELTDEDGEDEDEDTEMRDNVQDKDSRKIDVKNNEFELRHKEDADNLAEKAKSTQNQFTIFQEILDYRIRIQHSLILSNQLGQACENESRVGELRKSADKLIKNLLNLKQLLCNKDVTANGDDDDDEITSEESDKSDDDEDNDLKKETGNSSLVNEQNSNKKRLRLEEDIKQKHKAYKVHRDNILKKWHDKTRLTQISKSNKNEAETSIVDQINYILKENRSKLINKIHTRRMNYDVIGKNVDNTNDDNIDKEIFDDMDFYNEILREMMQTRTQNITDPIMLSKQWAVLNSLRKKVKKHVDTKASKGRRIRYIPHKKLVSFMAPNDYCEYTDEAKNALFQSLFGK